MKMHHTVKMYKGQRPRTPATANESRPSKAYKTAKNITDSKSADKEADSTAPSAADRRTGPPQERSTHKRGGPRNQNGGTQTNKHLFLTHKERDTHRQIPTDKYPNQTPQNKLGVPTKSIPTTSRQENITIIFSIK